MIFIGHRGAPDEAPENTMASFRRALELGADGIEFDVQETSDGQLVVIHDAMLDRTTNGTGAVLEHSFDQVRSLDAGSWFGPAFVSEAVPTLAEVLELPAAIFELETKTYGRRVLDSIVAAVDDRDLWDRVKFTGWNVLALSRLKAENPQATIGLFNHAPQPWMNDAVFERSILGTAETAGFDVVHVRASAITSRIVDGLHAMGLIVHANDAMNREEMQRTLDLGVDSLSGNDVAAGVALVNPTSS